MLYLIRHGETVLHKGICIGQTDIPLAEHGITYISEKTLPQLLALRLEQPRIVSSPLRRTMQTAEIIDNKLKTGIIQEPSLREINMGTWDGLPFSDIKKRWPDAYEQRGTNFAHFRAPMGESFFDVQQRALEIILPLCHEPEPVILVTHAGVIRTLLCAVNQTPLQNLFSYKPTTGSITLISKQAFLTNELCLE
ncbi:histidine phosphatase family protein [Halodesulfovibrio aestuarii]|uniref:Histidine phosphatase family protein n=1 Tax=Halodesulfovibrio aestuarii TaxID=126333 RepID=A0ABV4JSV4_9BACT